MCRTLTTKLSEVSSHALEGVPKQLVQRPSLAEDTIRLPTVGSQNLYVTELIGQSNCLNYGRGSWGPQVK